MIFRRENGEMPFSLDVFLLIYIFLFVFAYSLSDFYSSATEDYTPYKYLFCLFPFTFLVSGFALGKFWKLHKPRISFFAVPVALCMILPSAIFMHKISSNDINRFLFFYHPYSYELMGCNVVKFEPDRFRQIDLINRIKEEHRGYAFKGLANVLAGDFMKNAHWYKKGYFGKINQKFRPFFFLGLGAGLGELFPGDFTAPYYVVLNNVAFADRAFCYTGIGIFRTLDRGRLVELIKKLDNKNIGFFYKGMGIGFMELSGYNINRAETLASFVEERYRSFCLDGIKQSVYFKEYRPSILKLNREYKFP